MQFERTTDYALVRAIITHPKIYPWVTDDFAPPPGEFRAIESPLIWYLLVRDRDDLLGMWVLFPQNTICADVHTCLLPGHGFRRARHAAAEVARWVWMHTDFQRAVTTVPAFNRPALTFARDAGMVQFGNNKRSFMKHGKLYDQILLGMSKPEAKCQ